MLILVEVPNFPATTHRVKGYWPPQPGDIVLGIDGTPVVAGCKFIQPGIILEELPPPPPVTLHINWYPKDSVGSVYSSKEEADRRSNESRVRLTVEVPAEQLEGKANDAQFRLRL